MTESIPRYRVVLTKAGVVFILIILLLQLAAFNTGENLFYLVTSSVISFLFVGWWATRIGLRVIRVHRTTPDAVHRGESFASVVGVTNRHRFLPGVGMLLRSRHWTEPAWLNSLSAGSRAEFRAYETMPNRGRHSLSPVIIETTFPFGLISRRATFDDGQSVLVYPRVYPLSKRVIDELDDGGQRPKASFSDGDEFFSLREYIPGDDVRHISWKISARMGRLIVRELEPSISRMVVIVFDTRGVPGDTHDEENFELAMDLAASLSVALLAQHYAVALELPDDSIMLGRGASHATKILETLALANPSDQDAFGDDWYRPTGDHAEASKIFLATDPARWGVANIQGRGKTLNPRESIYG